MKKVLSIMLATLLLFVGANTVDAKSYTAYNAGDKITVNLNETTTGEFYVIENSDSSSNIVKAIYVGKLGEDVVWTYSDSICSYDNSVVDTELKSRTLSWTNTISISLPTVNDIVGEFNYTSQTALEELGARTNPEGFGIVHLENLTNVPFYALNNSKGTEYYTNSVLTSSDSFGTYCESYVYGYAMVDFPYVYVNIPNQNDEAGIRPVITVAKDYVIGGVTVTEDELLWERFVENYKSTELLANAMVDFTMPTSDSLKVVLSKGNDTITVNFTYANGIVTYVSTTDKSNLNIDNAELYINENFLVLNCLYALANLKDYDVEKVIAWAAEDRTFTLDNDGVEIEAFDYNYESNEDAGSVSISIDIITSFKLDIKNGLKISNDTIETPVEDNPTEVDVPKEEVVENPATGKFTQYSIVVVIILGIGTLGYIATRKHSKFPQV